MAADSIAPPGSRPERIRIATSSQDVLVMLNFPNPSRSYDATRRAVRFWGHESSMEWSFYMTEDALKRIGPDLVPGEAAFLSTFDANRELIYATAVKVHGRGRKGSYDLLPGDF